MRAMIARTVSQPAGDWPRLIGSWLLTLASLFRSVSAGESKLSPTAYVPVGFSNV